MRAITTAYKNHRFRSRTEARWAVFFDVLGLRWTYEEQGFTLLDGTNYLPDFWLPDLELWAEIKGADPDQEEAKRAYLLAEQSEHNVVILCSGPQDPRYKHPGDPGHWLFRPGARKALNATPAQLFGFERDGDPTLLRAYGEAMSARFEWGETPNVTRGSRDAPRRKRKRAAAMDEIRKLLRAGWTLQGGVRQPYILTHPDHPGTRRARKQSVEALSERGEIEIADALEYPVIWQLTETA